MEGVEDARSRNTYIGGSDAAGVLGMSRWSTPLAVWAEKTGQFIRPEQDSEAMELGRELEDYVAKRFERKSGKKVYRAHNKTVFHPDYPFLGATVDRLLVEEDAILECKTCAAWKSKEWEGDEIPQEYIIQCYHYMMVTGKKKAYICVLIGNQDFKWKEINYDEKLLASILKREVEFWNEFVLKKEMPAIIQRRDTDVLAGLFPEADEGKVIALDDEANILIETLGANKKDLAACEAAIEINENNLKALLKDAEAGQTSLYKVYWKNVLTKRFDQKAFELVYPELAKEYKTPKLSRRFTYKPLKENEHGL